MDFTLAAYQKLLETIQSTDQQIVTLHEFYCSQQPSKNHVVLRHDVDRRIVNSLKMAQLEAKLGIKASYYFRVPYTYDPTTIKEIAGLGHEVGFHYETLTKTKGHMEQAFQQFKQELTQLRQICDIHTICMHGSPLSAFDNRDLWQHYDFQSLGIIAEAYLSINYATTLYLTDTGRCWDSDALNLRDRVSAPRIDTPKLSTTDQLTQFMKNNAHSIIIQTHPERWAYSLPSFVLSYGMDKAANIAKRGIRLLRRYAPFSKTVPIK